MKKKEAQHSNERRIHERFKIKYKAKVSSDNQTPLESIIEDFSESGLLISYSDAVHLIRNEDLTPGNTLDIDFDVATPSGMKHFHLRACIARALDNGVGLQLMEPDPATIRVLHAISHHEKRRSKAHSSSHLDARKFVELCKEKMEQQLTTLTIQFFRLIRENLFNYGKEASNNTEQSQYMDARELLEKERKDLESSFLGNVLAQIDNFNAGQLQPSNTHNTEVSALSLIDKEIFDDWLVVRVIASKAESQFTGQLYQLHQRLSYLLRQEISEKNNPVGPTFICEAFQKVVHNLDIERNPERAIYEAFEKSIIAHLGTIYDLLNKMLIEHGILPVLKQKMAGKPDDDQSIAHRHDTDSQEEIEEIDAIPVKGSFQRGERDAGTGAAYSSQQEHAKAVHKRFSNIKQNIKHYQTEHENSSQSSSQPARPVNKQRSSFSTLKALSKLLSLRTAQATEPDESSTAPRLETESLIERLNFAQKNAKSQIDVPLRDTVGKMLDDDLTEYSSASISSEDNHAIDVIENLVQSVVTSKSLVPEVEGLFKEMRMPLLKLFLKDESFFDSKVHPARQILDRMARLGAKGAANSQIKSQLSSCVDAIINNDNQGLDIYFDQLKSLDTIIDRQNNIYKKNVERITKVCEGQQKTDKARRMVFQEIDKRIAGKTIPKLVVECLDAGWRNLLLLTSIREGTESKNWTLFLQVLDRLIALNQDNPPKVKVKLFINVMKSGLTTACGGQFKHDELLTNIESAIMKQENGDSNDDLETVDIPPIEIENEAKPAEPEPRKVIQDEQGKVFNIGKPTDKFSRWVKRAKRLQVGDWLDLLADDKSVQRVRLAWIGEDYSKLVFINHQGLKVVDLSLQEIAVMLQDKKAKYIVDGDNSVVNVALENMVKKIYDNLAHKATHDDMTDLLNRNEFERRVDRSIELALGEKIRHCVCHISIHQFKLFKSNYRYEDTDELLRQFSQYLRTLFYKDNNAIGRLGDAEFGLLLEQKSSEESYHLMSNFIESLEKQRFKIGDNDVTLNINIGMMPINTHHIKTRVILKQAEVASEQAEKAGINRIQIFRDEKPAQTNDVSWVTDIHSILNDGKLHLRSQAIHSLNESSEDDWPHSEILLAVVDEQGREKSPEELIFVAEEFKKMSLIDRWVIKRVFNWMTDHPEQVKALGGCSINLSGHSLNDESFTEFLFEEFASSTLNKDQICFEITETTAIGNLDEAADFIAELRNYGCHFSLDDFGSGLSSYAYLKYLPVDFIKIDGSFIRELTADSDDYAMVKSICEMGHYMGKKIIAESVETAEVLELLKEIGIDYAQGYHIQKPVSLTTTQPEAS